MMDSDKLTELLGQAEFVSQILGRNEPGDQDAD